MAKSKGGRDNIRSGGLQMHSCSRLPDSDSTLALIKLYNSRAHDLLFGDEPELVLWLACLFFFCHFRLSDFPG